MLPMKQFSEITEVRLAPRRFSSITGLIDEALTASRLLRATVSFEHESIDMTVDAASMSVDEVVEQWYKKKREQNRGEQSLVPYATPE